MHLFFIFELSLRCYMKQRKADMAYRSRAHRHPAHSPHTRRPRTRPAFYFLNPSRKTVRSHPSRARGRQQATLTRHHKALAHWHLWAIPPTRFRPRNPLLALSSRGSRAERDCNQGSGRERDGKRVALDGAPSFPPGYSLQPHIRARPIWCCRHRGWQRARRFQAGADD